MRGFLLPSLLASSLLAISLLGISALACDGQTAKPPTTGTGPGPVAATAGSAGEPTPNTTPPADSGAPADPSGGGATGPACGDKTCAADEQCIEYYGVAGPSGPKFKECGIPCPSGKGCPSGKTCQTIADGPGPVCR